MQRAKMIAVRGFVLTAVVVASMSTSTPRVYAANIHVTNLNDSGPGSLRQAILVASPGDRIGLDVTGIITLTSGELVIDKDLTIVGRRGRHAISGNGTSRVLRIVSGNVLLRRLTIRDGVADFFGGGIHNSGSSNLRGIVMRGNEAGDQGGALFNTGGGTVSIERSIISHNSTIFTHFDASGGGIYNEGGSTVTIADSAVINNFAADDGGGLYNAGGDNLMVVKNTPLSGNVALDKGGGIANGSGTSIFNNSTIVSNVAGEGGGIRDDFFDTTSLSNTIVANNSATVSPDCRGVPISLGYNLVEDLTDCGMVPLPSDLIGSDPDLGPLQNNEGRTFTHALLATSPAIDSGNPDPPTGADGTCETTDQRGVVRPQGVACDIGAYERLAQLGRWHEQSLGE